MLYDHLTAASVMTLGVCQGHSSITSFSMRVAQSLCYSRASCLVNILEHWYVIKAFAMCNIGA